MKKTAVTIQFDETKLNSIKYYLEKKEVDVQDELSKALDSLYTKVVPAQVREFIAMQNGESLPNQPKAKNRKPAKNKTEVKENNNEGS